MSRLSGSKRGRRHWALFLALCMPLLASAHDNARHHTSPQLTGNQAVAAAQSLEHSSGAAGMVLGEDQMMYSIATIGADGKLKIDYVTGEKNALTKVHAKPRTEAYDVR